MGSMARSLRTDTYTAVLTALVESRNSAEMTQQELANELGKPQSFVSKYENGERRLDIGEFLEIADAIGVDPCKLLGRVTRRRGSGRGSRAPKTRSR